jgi:ribosomal protein L7/L12
MLELVLGAAIGAGVVLGYGAVRRGRLLMSRQPAHPVDLRPVQLQPESFYRLCWMVQTGRVIQAIKLVRQHNPGLCLQEGKDFVFALRPEIELLPELSEPNAKAPMPALVRRARQLAADGKKIQAIHLVREQTNWSLREAKDYMDRLT